MAARPSRLAGREVAAAAAAVAPGVAAQAAAAPLPTPLPPAPAAGAAVAAAAGARPTRPAPAAAAGRAAQVQQAVAAGRARPSPRRAAAAGARPTHQQPGRAVQPPSPHPHPTHRRAPPPPGPSAHRQRQVAGPGGPRAAAAAVAPGGGCHGSTRHPLPRVEEGEGGRQQQQQRPPRRPTPRPAAGPEEQADPTRQQRPAAAGRAPAAAAQRVPARPRSPVGPRRAVGQRCSRAAPPRSQRPPSRHQPHPSLPGQAAEGVARIAAAGARPSCFARAMARPMAQWRAAGLRSRPPAPGAGRAGARPTHLAVQCSRRRRRHAPREAPSPRPGRAVEAEAVRQTHASAGGAAAAPTRWPPAPVPGRRGGARVGLSPRQGVEARTWDRRGGSGRWEREEESLPSRSMKFHSTILALPCARARTRVICVVRRDVHPLQVHALKAPPSMMFRPGHPSRRPLLAVVLALGAISAVRVAGKVVGGEREC